MASAVVYGTSIVVQHRTAQQHAGEGGEESAAGLLALARNPVLLLAIAGDFVGFLLQIIALSPGPVVVIQPLVVLMLPVSLVVELAAGRAPRPRAATTSACVGVLGGLARVPRPDRRARAPGTCRDPRYIGAGRSCIVLVAGASWPARRHRPQPGVMRGAMYGAVAGMYFGTLAVMVDAASDRIVRGRVRAAVQPRARGTRPAGRHRSCSARAASC